MIATRVIRVERKTQVVPSAPPPVAHRNVYGYYGIGIGGAYAGYAATPAAVQYDQVKVETRLFDAHGGALVWAAESEVFAPTDVKHDSADFAATLIAALAARKLI